MRLSAALLSVLLLLTVEGCAAPVLHSGQGPLSSRVAEILGEDPREVPIHVGDACGAPAMYREGSITLARETLQRPEYAVFLAHELAHAYLKDKGLPPVLEEGLAWYVASLATGVELELTEPTPELRRMVFALTYDEYLASPLRPQLDEAATWICRDSRIMCGPGTRL